MFNGHNDFLISSLGGQNFLGWETRPVWRFDNMYITRGMAEHSMNFARSSLNYNNIHFAWNANKYISELKSLNQIDVPFLRIITRTKEEEKSIPRPGFPFFYEIHVPHYLPPATALSLQKHVLSPLKQGPGLCGR